MKNKSLAQLPFISLLKVMVTSIALLSANSFAEIPGTSTAELKKEIAENANKFGVQATMQAVEGKASELAAAILMAANIAKTIEGCELYVVQISKDKPGLLLLTEVWTTQADHKASLENVDIRAIIEQARPLIANFEHKWGLPLGGKGF